MNKHAKDALKKITEHLRDNPNKIFPALAHILDMDGEMTIQAAKQANLADLFDEHPWPNTYHVWKKVPEYFLVAWLRTKLAWFSPEVYAMAKHHDSSIVRKIVEAMTGLSEKTRVPTECLNKVVRARFLDFLYEALGSRSELVEEAMNDEAEFDWASKGVWKVHRKKVGPDADATLPDGTWVALDSCSDRVSQVPPHQDS